MLKVVSFIVLVTPPCTKQLFPPESCTDTGHTGKRVVMVS